jgi:hypothetical protein
MIALHLLYAPPLRHGTSCCSHRFQVVSHIDMPCGGGEKMTSAWAQRQAKLLNDCHRFPRRVPSHGGPSARFRYALSNSRYKKKRVLTVHWPSVVPPCKGDTVYHHIVGGSLMARVGPSSGRAAVSGKLSRVSSTSCVQRCRRGAPLRQASVIMGRCGWRAPPVSARWSASGRRAHRDIPGHSSRKAGWRSSVACATRLAWAAPSARTASAASRCI